MDRVIKFSDSKNRKSREKYRDMVMGAFDDIEHSEKRDFLEKKARVERDGKRRL